MPVIDGSLYFPGTLCEWPEDGHGSGRGPDGVFRCKHCGLGHNEHGAGTAYRNVWNALNVHERDAHKICKVPLCLYCRERPRRVLGDHVTPTCTTSECQEAAYKASQRVVEISDAPDARPWRNTHRILLEQEIASIQSRIDMLKSIADARATRGMPLDAESADAQDFYQRLRQALIKLRRPIES